MNNDGWRNHIVPFKTWGIGSKLALTICFYDDREDIASAVGIYGIINEEN